MEKKTVAAAVVTGLVTLVSALGTGAAGFMMWALALNGFMGQERAVNASMITYVVLAAAAGIGAALLSSLAVYFLAGKRGWNAFLSSLLSIVLFAGATGAAHVACVVISAVVAEQMRTNR